MVAFARKSGTDPKYRSRVHREYRASLVRQLKRDGYLICTAKTCLFPTREITNPNGKERDGLHAGHDDTGTQYDGPQHNACNVSDGAKRARARQESTNLKWLQSEAAPHPWLVQDNHPCPICEAPVLWATQRCCSKACAIAYRRARTPQPEPMEPKRCETCGDQITDNRTAKWCAKHRGYQQRVTIKPCCDCGRDMECRQGPKQRCTTCAKAKAKATELARRRRRRHEASMG